MKENITREHLGEAQEQCVQDIQNAEMRLDLIRRASVAMDEALDLMEQADNLA